MGQHPRLVLPHDEVGVEALAARTAGRSGSRPTGRARRRAGAGRAAHGAVDGLPREDVPVADRDRQTSVPPHSGDDAGVDLFGWLRHGSHVHRGRSHSARGRSPRSARPRRRPTPQRRRARTSAASPASAAAHPPHRTAAHVVRPASTSSCRRRTASPKRPARPARPARRPGDPPRAVRPRARPGPRRAWARASRSRRATSRPASSAAASASVGPVAPGCGRDAPARRSPEPCRATSSIQTPACTWVPSSTTSASRHRVEHPAGPAVRPGRRGWPRGGARRPRARSAQRRDPLHPPRRGSRRDRPAEGPARGLEEELLHLVVEQAQHRAHHVGGEGRAARTWSSWSATSPAASPCWSWASATRRLSVTAASAAAPCHSPGSCSARPRQFCATAPVAAATSRHPASWRRPPPGRPPGARAARRGGRAR